MHPRRSVLIVEDDRDQAESLADFLALYGFEVRVAGSGEEAAALAAARPADAVVVDIRLPGMDGYAAARAVAAAQGWRPRLVAVSGYDDVDGRAAAEGFDQFFVKPADPYVLAELLDAPDEPAVVAGRARS